MSEQRSEYKWLIEENGWLGRTPSSDLVMRIPRAFPDDDDYYFQRRDMKVVPASRVFDTPQAAALAAIELNNEGIRDLQMRNRRLKEWHDDLETKRQQEEMEMVTR